MVQTVHPSQWRQLMAAAGLAAACLLPVPARATPHDAIVSGTMKDTIGEIIDLYERHGLSWADWIVWNVEPFTTTFWYYDANEYVIVVGDMPAPEDVPEYWTTWSKVLTDGNWDPAGFFASDAEALEMARFNQWVLATHESAHAITYRYDFEHRERHDYDINCREYYADRLTVAILNDEASRDADFARWRTRYVELVAQMGASIPDEFKVTQADYPALEKDCTTIAIEQPTPDRMQAYASAYFTRYQALLDADLPPLEAIFEQHLKARQRAKIAADGTAPGWEKTRIETIGQIPDAGDRGLMGARELEGYWAQRAFAIASDGTVYASEGNFDRDTHLLTLTYGPADQPLEVVAKNEAWPVDVERLLLRSIASYGPDSFVATLEDGETHAAAVRFDRNGDDWDATILANEEIAGAAIAFRLGEDRLFLAFSEIAIENSDERDKSWQVIETDLRTGESLSKTFVPIASRYPLGVDAEGRLFFDHGYMLRLAGSEGDFPRIAGVALRGNRDGDETVGELSDVQLLQVEPDGSLLILDKVAGENDFQLIRRVSKR